MLFGKLLFMALSLLLQAGTIKERPPTPEEIYDTRRPTGSPELALAERALAAHGLCTLAQSAPSAPATAKSAAVAAYASAKSVPGGMDTSGAADEARCTRDDLP